MDGMTSPWAPIVVALIAAIVTGTGYYLEYRKRKASELREAEATQREIEATNRANESEERRIVMERERDAFARENEFSREVEAVLSRALSDDPAHRDTGLTDLGGLRDRAPTPQRAVLIQAHIDRIHQRAVGRVTVDMTAYLQRALEQLRNPQAPDFPPSQSPQGQRIWEIARETAANNQELIELMAQQNEWQREMGQRLIDGDDFRPPGQ